DTAMTGEISLRGKVLPVGGIKEKVLAAHRAGIKRVILARRNERDLDDIPAEVRRELEIVPVDTVAEVLAAALEPAPAAPAEARTQAAAPAPARRAARRATSTSKPGAAARSAS